ncbi:MAG: site-2 protease family protein [Armatimonadetes bacterium]|nr:site-2 protease family protein [Armatimonadota bacterium]
MPDIVAAIIAFGVMIFCHELGHFLVAKRVGVTVYAFALPWEATCGWQGKT